ncbi:MAG: hypothetical protein K2X98_01145, partial [Alphaproteobacteria bacterium]|nr:hypothetical protein [Alphaproteobacteria bacterium]
HRNKEKAALSNAFNNLTMTNVPAEILAHTQGVKNYITTAESLINNTMADISAFTKRMHFDPKTVLTDFENKHESFAYLSIIMEKFKDIKIPIPGKQADTYPFISRLLPHDQAKKILEINLWLRQLQEWQKKNPGMITPLSPDEIKAVHDILGATGITAKGIGFSNMNLLNLRRNDIFDKITPNVLWHLDDNTIKSHNLGGGLNLGGFINLGLPLIGYNLTQSYNPKDTNINTYLESRKNNTILMATEKNMHTNLDTLRTHLNAALTLKQIKPDIVRDNSVPAPLHQNWWTLKVYFLTLRDKIQEMIQNTLASNTFKKAFGRNQDIDDLNKITNYFENITGLDFEKTLINRDSDNYETLRFIALSPNRTQENGPQESYLSDLKWFSEQSPKDYHNLDTYHLMWMIKVSMFVKQEKMLASDEENLLTNLKKILSHSVDDGYSGTTYEINSTRLANLDYFWTFIETFTPDTKEETEDFVVVMKQLIPRLEYGLQLRMLMNGKPIYTPMDFWEDLAW